MRILERFVGEDGRPHRPERDAEIREHLANERTLLAWVRTGVGLISLGFVVERAGALTAAGAEGASDVFGLALVALGCLTLLVGTAQYFRNRSMIREGIFASRAAPYMVVVVGSLLLAAAFAVYVLLL
ncbi:hypothetical protein Rxycam_02700 [Rubrobacter xylanophilus DSM 9941]|uniref:YidH family protein n=1 Tax=Rubrobacter xylanophilus TaxID=49319 RepID=UPI001C63DBD7|nr:DUF202 domain-containing protein [Rubrobacter xylanophilus]QYJ16864.1 hypothetical protein Rxycam_02700 [Rubrobacter xylanophilus DSM 9941]